MSLNQQPAPLYTITIHPWDVQKALEQKQFTKKELIKRAKFDIEKSLLAAINKNLSAL